MPQLIPFFFVNQVLFNFVTISYLELLKKNLSIFLVISLVIILFKGPSAVTGSPPKIKPPAEKPRPKPGSGNTPPPPPPKGLQVPRV